LEDIITDHAGTVIGGSHERSGPYSPLRQIDFKFGKSSSHRSKINSGAAQSNPITITRRPAFSVPGPKVWFRMSREDRSENIFPAFRVEQVSG
jgi:hypothetical protein